MKIAPLNKYYFDKSYIADKHDPNHDKRVHATIARLRAFQLENTLGRSSETGVTLGIDS